MAPIVRTPLIFLALAAALLIQCGCDSGGSAAGDTGEVAESGLPIERVKIQGETFRLELAADDASRVRGMGMRRSVDEDGGMLFAFPLANELNFLMRDCFISLDIIYVDGQGRVTATHHMPAEEPRGPSEGEAGDTNPLDRDNQRYEARLPKYPSRFRAQFAIELKGGTLDRLEEKTGQRISVGEVIELDLDRLKRLAR